MSNIEREEFKAILENLGVEDLGGDSFQWQQDTMVLLHQVYEAGKNIATPPQPQAAAVPDDVKNLLAIFRARLGGAYWSLDEEEKDLADRIDALLSAQTQTPCDGWVQIKDPDRDTPEPGEYLCKLQWPSGKVVHQVLNRVDSEDHDWECDGSELTLTVSVIAYHQIPTAQPPQEG